MKLMHKTDILFLNQNPTNTLYLRDLIMTFISLEKDNSAIF